MYTNVFIVYIVAVLIDVAIIVDIGGVIIIVAGRPQPPPQESPFSQNPRL